MGVRILGNKRAYQELSRQGWMTIKDEVLDQAPIEDFVMKDEAPHISLLNAPFLSIFLKYLRAMMVESIRHSAMRLTKKSRKVKIAFSIIYF